MKKIVTIGSFIILIITKIESIWAFINLIKDKKMETVNSVISIESGQYWLFHSISAIIIFVLSYVLLNKLDNIRKEISLTNLIDGYRRQKFFIEIGYSKSKYFKTPNETDEHYFNRIPEGQYRKYLKEEYDEVKQLAIKKYSKMTLGEVIRIVDKIYGLEDKKKKT